jgi:membrane protein
MMAASSKPGKGLMAMVIGIVTLLFGASAVFAHLQSMLNLIWEVEPKEGRGILGVIKSRFFSFTLVVGTGFLLLVSLVISTGLAALNTVIEAYIPGGAVLAYAVNFLISFVVITGIFAMIYKLVPDAAVRWSDVWTGASLTALLFILGKFLIGLYLGHSSMASAYGAVGSILIILLWVYYSAQILFFGAEFTQVYARRRGATIKPTAEAVRKQTECTT